jgi:D-alanyl-lipoteichoic acid acyltransferase DltB (MBOAT superfamily)
MTEASCIAAGMGETRQNQASVKSLYDINNINILNVEFATNASQFWKNWNMRTQVYLKQCVYRRLPTSHSSFKVMTTFLFSGVWVWHDPLTFDANTPLTNITKHGLCFRVRQYYALKSFAFTYS